MKKRLFVVAMLLCFAFSIQFAFSQNNSNFQTYQSVGLQTDLLANTPLIPQHYSLTLFISA